MICNGHVSVLEIIDQIKKEFKSESEKTVKSDVEEFIGELIKIGVIMEWKK